MRAGNITAWASAGILTGASILAHAQVPDPAQVAKAQQLFSVMHMQSTYEQLTRQVMDSVQSSEDQLFPGNNLTPALKQEQAKFHAEVMALVNANIAWPRLEPDFAKAYAQAYTAQQLDGLIAFYSSPLGQAVLAKQPELLHDSSMIAQQHLQTMLPTMQQMLHDEAAKIQSMTGTTPSKPGSN